MSELETIVLHEPIVLTEPTRAFFLCAECFTPNGAAAAVTIRNYRGGDPWELVIGGAQTLEDAPAAHGLLIEDAEGLDFDRLEVRGFLYTGVLARGWQNGSASNVHITDCEVGLNLDYIPANGKYNENLTLEHLRLGDTWSIKHADNVFRPGRMRGGNNSYIHTAKDVYVRELRTRGECFGSIKLTNCENVTLEQCVLGGIQVSGFVPPEAVARVQSTVLRDSMVHKMASHSYLDGDTKALMVTDGARGCLIERCTFGAIKSPEEEERGAEMQLVQVTGESQCTMRDVMILGPADVGFDWRATPTADFGGSELTLEGDLRIERCEVPFRVR